MQSTNIPAKFPVPFANNAGAGYIRPIPTTSQIGITNGAASLPDGFPPLNFLPVGSGGVPPFGQDMNGILNAVTAWNQWQQAGGPVFYDSGFATSIGGYPAGAVLMSTTLAYEWLCTVDNNASNPDAGGSGWIQLGVNQGSLAAFRIPSNFQVYKTTTRAVMSAAAGAFVYPWTGIPNYVKQNSASVTNVVAILSIPYWFAGSSGQAATFLSLTIGPTSNVSVASENQSAQLVGQTNMTAVFSGVPSGPQTISLSYTEPAYSWTGVFCPTGADYVGFAGGTTATITLFEIPL